MSIHIKKEIRVMLTGGGTGGHIYPLLSVLDYLKKVGEGSIKITYAGQVGSFRNEFEDRYIKTYHVTSSKIRRYFDLRNIIDAPKFLFSLLEAFLWVYVEMPDVVFSKGGPGAFAVVLAARFYRIPVIIHESDAAPSVTNILCARFAERIAISFEATAGVFPKEKVLLTGNPIREVILADWGDQAGHKRYFGFDSDRPMVLVLGGSQGSERINNFIFENLEALLEFQICHQVGGANFQKSAGLVQAMLKDLPPELRGKYVIRGYFDVKEMKIALSAADLVITRSGAGAIFEIAAIGRPAILIPLKESANDHQMINAYEYAKGGAAIVVEEDNLKPHILLQQIKKILNDSNRLQMMASAAKAFAKPDAAERVGKEILRMVGVELS